MKNLIVYPSKLSGEITVPSSKSQSHRALIFGAMGKGETTVRHLLRSPDTEGMIRSWRTLGAVIDDKGKTVKIAGLGGKLDGASDVIDVGNSGVALRFLSALGALSSKPIVITGDRSIRYQRPMHSLLRAFEQLGVTAISTKGDGFAPIIIQGPFKGGTATVDGRDSQPVSALLIASIFASGPTEIIVENAGETPWVELTLHWFKKLGVIYTREGYDRYSVKGNQSYAGFEYTVPGDFSSAAFPIAAALVTNSEISLHNIDMDDAQGDKKVIDIFRAMGAKISVENRTLKVHKNNSLKGLTIDINECIDAITIVAAVACYAQGETHITNGAVAREKECDRIAAIEQELRKMGAKITANHDRLIVKGGQLVGSSVDSHDDHRVAMSLAVAGLGAQGKTGVKNIDCVAKTYPSFVEDFKMIAAKLKG